MEQIRFSDAKNTFGFCLASTVSEKLYWQAEWRDPGCVYVGFMESGQHAVVRTVSNVSIWMKLVVRERSCP